MRTDAGNDAAIDAAIDAGRAAAAAAAPGASFPPAKPGGNDAASTPPARAAVRATDAPNDAIDAQAVVARLEEAGRTLLALPGPRPGPRLRSSVWTVLASAIEGHADQPARMRPAVPGSARISRMDEAFGWLALIPQDRYVLRRILGARALIHPLTGRHLYPWRRLGTALGADHKAVQRWHAQGVALIVKGLAQGPGACRPGAGPR